MSMRLCVAWPGTGGHPRAAAAVAGIAVALWLVLALWLALLVRAGAQVHPPGVDLLGHRLVHGSTDGMWTQVARGVSIAGSSPVLYPVTGVIAALISLQRGAARLLDALLVLVALGIGSAARVGVSVVIGRARPPVADWLYHANGFAFPSGHTTNTTIAVGLLVLLYRQTGPLRWRCSIAWALAVVAAASVGWSRVYLGVHWPSDVAGGWLFGVGWVALVALVGDRRPVNR
ncbi:MAG: phosphatase PAP2 family protein [Actinomycetota bacterium]|nr:phosphatase PAP2 family protein [Actinomycetota bacterium]